MKPRALPLGCRLDRYVARLFALSYCAAFFLVVGLFVIIDMATNLDEYMSPDKSGVTPPTGMVGRYCLLQLPFLYHAFTHTSDAGPTRALAGATQALGGPAAFRLSESTAALGQLGARILFAPWFSSWWALLLAASVVVVVVRARRDLALLATTVLPLACTALGFALWQGAYDEYWYLPVAPCFALTLTLAATWWRPERTAIALVVLVLSAQPFRLSYAHDIYRMPEYGALARGAREIFRQTPVIRRLDTTFRVQALSDPGFPYETMGGRIADDGLFDATIDESGRVRFTPVPR